MVVANKAKTVTKKVKLFKNGASQAVRLPADFRFEGSEIYATRDPETGEVLLSTTPPLEQGDQWGAFFALRDKLIDPEDPEVIDYMSERPLNVNFDLSRVVHEDDEA